MTWFSRKPTLRKQVESANKVATNLYLRTIPEAEDSPAPLHFGLRDSRYRYLMFCLSTVMRACAPKMKKETFAVIFNECLHCSATFASADESREFFVSPVTYEDAVKCGNAYLHEFSNNWSKYIELEKDNRNPEMTELICSMIHATESDVPAKTTDIERLENLALWIESRLITMQDAFIDLVQR